MPSGNLNFTATALLTRDEVQQHYERYAARYFTADGRVDLDIAWHAIDSVAAELGVAAVAADEIYQPPEGL